MATAIAVVENQQTWPVVARVTPLSKAITPQFIAQHTRKLRYDQSQYWHLIMSQIYRQLLRESQLCPSLTAKNGLRHPHQNRCDQTNPRQQKIAKETRRIITSEKFPVCRTLQ